MYLQRPSLQVIQQASDCCMRAVGVPTTDMPIEYECRRINSKRKALPSVRKVPIEAQ